MPWKYLSDSGLLCWENECIATKRLPPRGRHCRRQSSIRNDFLTQPFRLFYLDYLSIMAIGIFIRAHECLFVGIFNIWRPRSNRFSLHLFGVFCVSCMCLFSHFQNMLSTFFTQKFSEIAVKCVCVLVLAHNRSVASTKWFRRKVTVLVFIFRRKKKALIIQSCCISKFYFWSLSHGQTEILLCPSAMTYFLVLCRPFSNEKFKFYLPNWNANT